MAQPQVAALSVLGKCSSSYREALDEKYCCRCGRVEMTQTLPRVMVVPRRCWRAVEIAAVVIFVSALIAPQPVRAQKFEILYAFKGGSDGLAPTGNMARDAAGNLYGTTGDGGNSTACSGGCGTIFKLDPQAKETVLHSFSSTDGSFPYSVILDGAGNLYGVTIFGGNSCIPGFGTCGVVFKFDTTTNTFTLLHKFTGGSDGENPEASLILDGDGNLYGTTVAGGVGCLNQNPPGCGILFKIDKNGRKTILHLFDGDGGEDSSSSLLLGSDGNLYGATIEGGAFLPSVFDYIGCHGTVFKVDPKGKETVLHSFSGLTPDNGVPYAQLIEDEEGNLYGTTEFHPPGSTIFGTVFKISKNGGPMKELFTFNDSDGGYPLAGLTRDSSGNLYGTVSGGFACECGGVFKLDPQGRMTVLHQFDGRDGEFPQSVLLLDGAGNLYGNAAGGPHDAGIVFRITP
jgi:uncharacterized repeat protein (TIGR03803 family)